MDGIAIFSHCIIVKGISRSAICDLQRNKCHLIPNSFSEIFKDGFMEINMHFENAESKIIIEEYFDFLINEELGFKCNRLKLINFPKLPLEWIFPAFISNCVIEFNSVESYFNEELLYQIEELSCRYIQLIIYEYLPVEKLKEIFSIIEISKLESFSILLRYSDFTIESDLTELLISSTKLSSVVIFNANTTEVVNSGESGMGVLINQMGDISGHHFCGLIDISLFSINIPTFTESQKFNTCLNRKISIDSEGNIKNCPSMAKSFGNIRDTKLIDVVNNPDFQKVWHIKKDEISKCKDCEFRHVCTDCRAYIENPEDQFSAPLKCGYNPYTCEWEEWSTNPLKQKAIEYYGMQELVKKQNQ